VDQATILVRASAAPCTARFRADEAVLIDQARQLPTGQLPAVVRHWRQRAEAEVDVDETDLGHVGRHLHASVTSDSRVALDGV